MLSKELLHPPNNTSVSPGQPIDIMDIGFPVEESPYGFFTGRGEITECTSTLVADSTRASSASPLQTEWTGSATFHGQKTVSPHSRMIQPLPNLLSRSTRTHSPNPLAGNEMNEKPADRVTGVPIEDCLPEIITIYDSSDEAEESDDDEVEFISERIVIPIDDDVEEELYGPLNRPNVAPAPNPAPVTNVEYAMDIVIDKLLDDMENGYAIENILRDPKNVHKYALERVNKLVGIGGRPVERDIPPVSDVVKTIEARILDRMVDIKHAAEDTTMKAVKNGVLLPPPIDPVFERPSRAEPPPIDPVLERASRTEPTSASPSTSICRINRSLNIPLVNSPYYSAPPAGMRSCFCPVIMIDGDQLSNKCVPILDSAVAEVHLFVGPWRPVPYMEFSSVHQCERHHIEAADYDLQASAMMMLVHGHLRNRVVYVFSKDRAMANVADILKDHGVEAYLLCSDEGLEALMYQLEYLSRLKGPKHGYHFRTTRRSTFDKRTYFDAVRGTEKKQALEHVHRQAGK